MKFGGCPGPVRDMTISVISNRRHGCPGMVDGVDLIKENGFYTVYRYIEDWDEEGDTIYEVNEYLRDIPEEALKREIGVVTDGAVARWIRAHLIKEKSNALDDIVEFLGKHNVPYSY